jgi:Protein of unknown function (DUF1552)
MKAVRIRSRCHWLSRRAFLGGASALIALPSLETLNAKFAVAAGATPPLRFLSWYFPCGVSRIASWPKLLGGLDPVKTKYSMLLGLGNVGNSPDHAHGTRAFMTGAYTGFSFDQRLGDALVAKGGNAPLHSLQLGAPDDRCEGGAPCDYMNNVTWRENVLPKQMRPDLAFNALFSGFDPGASDVAAKERAALRSSVLDLVSEDAQNLSKILSANDKLRLDEYMTSIREAEADIAALGSGAGTVGVACGKPIPGLSEQANAFKSMVDNKGRVSSAQLDVAMDAHIEVMALAFKCDLTRVISFMAGAGGSAQQSLGTNQDYHLDIGHGDRVADFDKVVTWEMEKFGKLLARLDAEKEGDGSSILDNLVAFSSSEICEGQRHNHDNMPVVLAGGLGGKLKLGAPVQVGNKFVDLFAFLAQQMGAPVTGFGNASLIKGLTG